MPPVTFERAALRQARTLAVTSPAFAEGGAIPRSYSGLGEDCSPPLELDGVPAAAAALALVMDDPDAPRGTFTHWTAWDLRPDLRRIDEGADVRALGGEEGRNDFGGTGYRGPLPPSGTHRYRFHVFALARPLGLPRGADVADVWGALAEATLAWGELTGTFSARGAR